MSKISTYEVVPVPKLADKLIGTSVGGEIEDVTYNFTLQELLDLYIPLMPANNLQGILDFGNTATQDINLFGTITTTNLEVTDTANLFITYLNEETHIVGSVFDSEDSAGTSGQVLTSTGDGVEWVTLPPIFTPNLQQVLEEGNTADLDIVLDANIQAFDISSDTANIGTQLTIQGTVVDYNESGGTAGQVLSSTSSNVAWVSLPVYSATSPLLFNSATGVFSIQQATSSQNGYLSSSDWITFDGKQNAGNYITALTGEATASGPGSATVTLSNAAVIGKVLTGFNPIAGTINPSDSILTAFGKTQSQINALVGGVQYQGTWNASTNVPTLVSSVGTQGYYYIVSVAGTTNLNGITDWQVGDWAIFSESTWQKVDNTDSVTSVNGFTGAVSLTTDNIPEGLTNLYFLNSRARAAVSATSPLLYNNTTGVFSIQQASGTQNGFLSNTDWTTFNSKQDYLGGTGLVKSTAGTITYITDNSGNWNTAYNDSIVSAAVTGTGTKTLTLNQQDGGTIQASWTDADTGLTSVGLTMPSAFTVANSPLTSNGTIGVTGAGTTAEYIRGDGSLATFPSIISEAQNLVTEVYNSSGATLTKGTVVYINGGQGNLPTITKAIATGDATSAQTYGVVRSDITNMNNGYVVVTGRLADLDTRDYTPGQQLYLSSTTAGAWTPTKQYAPAHLVYVAIVVRAHPTQGVVEVLIQNGFEMDELHNVAAQNPDNNDILQYKTSTNLWTKVAGTTTNIAEGTNLYYLDSRARASLSLTTTGSSGAATYNSTTGVFNIPNYGNALSAYVPYNGATADVNLGVYTLNANSININGPGAGGFGGGYLGLKQSLSLLIAGGGYTSINGEDKTYLSMYFSQDSIGTNFKQARFNVSALTNNTQRTYSLPDASGTLALTSNLTGYLTAVTASSPLASSGGTTPNITIQQSSGSQDGYLSSTDWTTFNNKQAAGNYITSLTGEATATGPGAAAVTLNNASVTAKILTGINITGGTVQATDTMLTAFGKLQNQINGLIGSTIYQGTWNASTNTPALASGVGVRGYYYIVSVAGNTNLDGITDWFVGDWAIFDGTAWQQVDNTDAVVSVNGQTGAVSLTTDNIPEGATNQYFLNSRARAALSFTAGSGAYNSTTGVITIPTNTSQLTNGANFITLASLSGTAPIQYNSGTGAISITQAGSSTNGFLSSTDWNTFNNKQNALTNPITGTGVSGRVAFYNDLTSITSSNNFFWDATNSRLGIGLTNPQRSLEIFSTIADSHLRLSGNAPSVSLGEAITGSIYQAKFGLATANGQYAAGAVAGDFVIISQTGATIFSTSSTEKMRLDTSGNLGLGVTPSAWFVGKALEIGFVGNSIWGPTANNFQFMAGVAYVSNAYQYQVTGEAVTNYRQTLGEHRFFTAPSGTAGNAISFTQAMTLNASGNLSVGNTNDTYKLDVTTSSNDGIAVMPSESSQYINSTVFTDLTVNGTFIGIKRPSNGSPILNGIGTYDSSTGNNLAITSRSNIVFATDNAVRLTIASTGAATFSSTISTPSFISSDTEFRLGAAFARVATLDAGAGFGGGYNLNWNNASPIHNSTGALSGYAYANGGSINFYSNSSASAGTAAPLRMTITSGGIVQVNTTASIGGGVMNLNGDLRFGGAAGASYSIINYQGGSLNLGTNNTTNLTLASTGAATFSSSVTAGGYITGQGSNPGGLGGSRFVLDWLSGQMRIFSYGANTSTNGGFVFNSQRSDGTNSINYLDIASTGAATFSSSVTATQFIVGSGTTSSDVSVRYKTDTGDFSTINDRGSHAFGIYDHQVSLYRMYINSSGNVGIGINNPTAILQVRGPNAVGTFFDAQNDGAAGATFSRINASSFPFNQYIFANGYVGIGNNSPNSALDVTGTIRTRTAGSAASLLLQNTSASSKWEIGYEATSDNFYIYSYGSGNSPFRITSGGNVAIGNTTAASPLSVWGAGGLGVYSTNSYASSIYLNFNGGTNIGHLLVDQNAFYIRTNTSYPIYVQANSANGVYLSVGATSWTANSDERLKYINSNIENAVDKLKTLRAINYSWKLDETKKQNLGLIAQDVEKVFPQLIDLNKDGYLGVRYAELVPVLVAAIQELKAELDTLKNK